MISNLYSIILAGGSGGRLWPLSREMYPKQLLKLTGKNTLLQSTYLRLTKLMPTKNITVVTNIKHASDIKLQLNEFNEDTAHDNTRIIIEPLSRNTAPAIALSTFYIVKKVVKESFDPIILVCPSDHILTDVKQFIDSIEKGIKLANSGFIVTFGVKPESPETGYGYIKTQKQDDISRIENVGLKVEEFKEKPDLETVKKYIELGIYYWNSGIFMSRASVLINELKLHAQDILGKIEKSDFSESGPTVRFDDYEELPDISFDYAVMEKAKNIALVPLDCGWNDLGSWQSIYDISEKDQNNNFISGNIIDLNSKNSLIYSSSKLVATIGLENVIIVETDDAVLACNKSRSQDVKKIFENLKKINEESCIIHKTIYRPWGFYTVLEKGDGFLIKTIQVNSKAKLSLQMHHHRSEHWVILSGTAKVIKDNQEIFLNPGDSTDIPKTIKHSLENPGTSDLKLIEIQKGSYLSEDDIVRFEDLYGRELY